MELFYFIYHEKYCIDHEITNITTINSPYSIFYELLEKFRPFITKKTTNMRSPVSAEEKLAITLRYLATAESLNSLRCQLHVHETTIRKFITRVCEAICKVLASDYMNCPSTKQEWEYIVDQTNSRWQFPNYFAAADGKHIGIICPKNSGSQFYNYKGFFSIVLLGFVNYGYKFLVAEVGCQGRISDGGVFRNSAFNLALSNNSLNLPDPKPLSATNDPFWVTVGEPKKIPMVFVAGDAFPLTKHCMKPYGRKNLSDEERVFERVLFTFPKD